MSERPLGDPIDFRGAKLPSRAPLTGRHVLLRPVDAAGDAAALFEAARGELDVWRYLPYGPYPGAEALRADLERLTVGEDPLFFSIVPRDIGQPQGVASYLRVTPEHGCIEIGHIWFGAALRRSVAATEAIYLLARRAFDELGYRRLEWKCDALNAASRRAAGRFGFRFEGVFERHQVVKGRNRDTAWFAITEDRWPAVRAAYEAWLEPSNFDGAGRQRRSLGSLGSLGHGQ